METVADRTAAYKPRKRRWLTPRERQERAEAALARGSRSMPNGNDVQAILEFANRGIPLEEIDTFGPNQNVRTYNAWRALGRQVRKGEKSVRLPVWYPIDSDCKDDEALAGRGDIPADKRPRCRLVTACVFHVSQTDPIAESTVTA